jgi:hypothetical protein
VNARAEEIAAYNSAYDAWTAPVAGTAAAFRAMGPFSLAVDNQVWVNLTAAAIEPAAVESGDGIAAYLERAAYTTSLSPFTAGSMSFGSSDVVRTFTLRDRNGATVWTQAITLATQRSYAGSSRRTTCTYGTRVSGRCISSFYPSSGGMCIVIDATTRAYAGGCAQSSESAADAWSYGEAPGVVGGGGRREGGVLRLRRPCSRRGDCV